MIDITDKPCRGEPLGRPPIRDRVGATLVSPFSVSPQRHRGREICRGEPLGRPPIRGSCRGVSLRRPLVQPHFVGRFGEKTLHNSPVATDRYFKYFFASSDAHDRSERLTESPLQGLSGTNERLYPASFYPIPGPSPVNLGRVTRRQNWDIPVLCQRKHRASSFSARALPLP